MFPFLFELQHSPISKCFVRSTEITFILTALEVLKTFQEAWFGKGKLLLSKFSRSVSFLQNQEGLLPNERDVISVISFPSPTMCKDVNGDAPAFFYCSDNARTNCISTNEPLAARRLTHPTVGELSLNNVTYAALNCGKTSPIASHNINNPTISKS